jgi:NAD-dependent DNA ligase
MEKVVSKLSKLSKTELKKGLKKLEVDILIEIQTYLDDKYYNSGEESGFSDEQYDILKDIIENSQNYKHKVGSKIREDDNKVKLPIWLGSLDKIKAEESDKLSKWLNKNKNEFYTIESKLDGVSCLLTYKNNVLKLYTRGDGSEGSDITHLTEYIKSVPKNFSTDISVRGELIIKEKTFKDKYSKTFANPRNMVSGIVNSKSLREGVYDIDFVAYEKINDGTIQYKPSQQIEVLKELNFIVEPILTCMNNV